MVASKLNDEYGDTVPSRPPNIGVQEAADLSSYSTVRKLHKLEDDSGEGLCFFHLFSSLTPLFLKVDILMLLKYEGLQEGQGL